MGEAARHDHRVDAVDRRLAVPEHLGVAAEVADRLHRVELAVRAGEQDDADAAAIRRARRPRSITSASSITGLIRKRWVTSSAWAWAAASSSASSENRNALPTRTPEIPSNPRLGQRPLDRGALGVGDPGPQAGLHQHREQHEVDPSGDPGPSRTRRLVQGCLGRRRFVANGGSAVFTANLTSMSPLDRRAFLKTTAASAGPARRREGRGPSGRPPEPRAAQLGPDPRRPLHPDRPRRRRDDGEPIGRPLPRLVRRREPGVRRHAAALLPRRRRHRRAHRDWGDGGPSATTTAAASRDPGHGHGARRGAGSQTPRRRRARRARRLPLSTAPATTSSRSRYYQAERHPGRRPRSPRQFTTFDRYFCSLARLHLPRTASTCTPARAAASPTTTSRRSGLGATRSGSLGFDWPTIWSACSTQGRHLEVLLLEPPGDRAVGPAPRQGRPPHLGVLRRLRRRHAAPGRVHRSRSSSAPEGLANDDHPHADLRLGQVFLSDISALVHGVVPLARRRAVHHLRRVGRLLGPRRRRRWSTTPAPASPSASSASSGSGCRHGVVSPYAAGGQVDQRRLRPHVDPQVHRDQLGPEDDERLGSGHARSGEPQHPSTPSATSPRPARPARRSSTRLPTRRPPPPTCPARATTRRCPTCSSSSTTAGWRPTASAPTSPSPTPTARLSRCFGRSRRAPEPCTLNPLLCAPATAERCCAHTRSSCDSQGPRASRRTSGR